MSIKDHGQGFAAALGMPEYAALAIRSHPFLRGFNGFPYSKILMVSGQNLKLFYSLIRETDKILDNIQQALLFNHSFKKCIKLRILGVLITAVFGLPFHEPIFTGSNGSCLGSQMVTHDTDTVIDKHGRNFMHIISDLCICFRCICFFPGRRFELHQHNRQAV